LYPPTIVGKKRDHRILDSLIFSGKIRKKEKVRKNTLSVRFSENLGKIQKKLGKIQKNIRKNSLEKIEN